MSMIAVYQQTTDEIIKDLKNSGDAADYVWEAQESDDTDVCDIDKMWDALHFLLTSKTLQEPIEDNLLSEAVVGQSILSEDEFISGIYSDRVQEIAQALGEIDFEKYIEKFNMEDFYKNDIYPAIWDREEEKELIIEDLRYSFKTIKEFYTRMAEKKCAVIVSIC